MLLDPDEIRYDFGGARFELPGDRDALGWIFSQFLYGEVTGIQVGHWIHHAPDLDKAQFLVRQCAQELSHVRLMRKVFDLLDTEPQPAHRVVKFLSTGLMGADWNEHVCLEMALGEGYVLTAFYALVDTVPDATVRRLLRVAVRQEETHVGFGEAQTARAARDLRVRRHLLGMSLVSLMAVRRLAASMGRRMQRQHPVWRQLPGFARHTAAVSELRLRRMGVLDTPLSAMPRRRLWGLMARGLAARAVSPLRPSRNRLLTRTYLDDPQIARSPVAGPS
ncbi:MAG: ferritin-like domain-containing protein [Candidatus Krumholzibacteriia bacterium]